ncbi:hypothetical protein JCM8208_006716 [Rhodotorula glutinis]
MQLVLVPPTSLPIPRRLQTHEIPTPVVDTHLDDLRIPRGFLVARKALKNVGLEQKNYLAFDSTAWWQVVVRSVEWNLEDEALVVTLVDGTEERWDLAADGGGARSEAFIAGEDGMSTTEPGGNAQDGDVQMRDGTVPRHGSPWAPSTVLEHLHALCTGLRSAYEDLGMVREFDDRAVEIDSEDDWSALHDLSADHDMMVPFALSDAQSSYEYAMSGLDEDDDSGASQRRINSSRRARRPSQAASVGSEDDSDGDSAKYTGQFVPQYRDRSTKASLAVEEPMHQHDYLSTIHLLARIRAYLANLFARVVIPKLRDTLPVTYSLWAASGAVVWCRREAIRLGGEVARLMLDLLEDDGDVFDADSASEPSQPDILVADEDDEYALGPSFVGSAHQSPSSGGMYDELAEWRAEERRIQRLSHNVLISLQGDYELRRWCEAAIERARTFALSAELVEVAPPRWIEPVPSQEVSHTLDGDESDLDQPPSKRVFEYRRPRSTSSAAASPPTSPPPETVEPRRKRARSLTESLGSDDSIDDGSSDEDDELDSLMRLETDFFYPEDPLDEEFLPPRLPKELVRASASRGDEMEEHRARVHELLNKINGLQHKVVELQGFVAKEASRWETNLEEARKPKEATTPVLSGLRLSGPSEDSPPPRELTKKPVPLKAQPLRKQAGDRALARSLDSALEALQSPAGPVALEQVKVPTVHVHSAAPRRKQKSNLETYVKVVALSRGVEAVTPPRSRIELSGQKKRKRPRGPSVGGHWSHAPGRSPAKRPRLKLVKREGASADLSIASSSSAQQVFGSLTTATASAAAASASTQDPRHLAALELSNRRRGAVAAASARMPVSWAEDEEDEEKDEDEVDGWWRSGEAEGEGSSLGHSRSMTGEMSKYWDESDSSDDEAVELELVDVDAVAPSPGPSSPAFSARPDSPYQDEYEAPTRPGTAAAPSSPSPIPSAPSLLVLPNLGPLFPLSAERSLLDARPTPSIDAGPADPAEGGPSSLDDEPFLFAPRPRRPTFSILAPTPTADADTSDVPSSPSSSPPDISSPPGPAGVETSLAQRVRDRFACVADPPVQLVPPLTLDWPTEAAHWDDGDGYELVLGLDVGDEDGGGPTA